MRAALRGPSKYFPRGYAGWASSTVCLKDSRANDCGKLHSSHAKSATSCMWIGAGGEPIGPVICGKKAMRMMRRAFGGTGDTWWGTTRADIRLNARIAGRSLDVSRLCVEGSSGIRTGGFHDAGIRRGTSPRRYDYLGRSAGIASRRRRTAGAARWLGKTPVHSG